MESQLQNPEFRINSENFPPCMYHSSHMTSKQRSTRLHSAIRFSIDENVNILNYIYKIYQTSLISNYHPCQLVSMNNNLCFPAQSRTISH